MNCINCGKAIYCTIDGVWYHIGGMIFCDMRSHNRNVAEPNIDEPKPVCANCGKPIYQHEKGLWIHRGWGMCCEYPIVAGRVAKPIEEDRKDTCRNCHKPIIHDSNGWYHDRGVNSYNVERCGLGYGNSVAEPSVDVCEHCGREIQLTRNEPYMWEHKIGPYMYCSIIDPDIAMNFKAKPKDGLVILDEVNPEAPTDCIKCNEIRYTGNELYADRAVCHIIDMSDIDIHDPSYILFMFKANRPQSFIPPSWCPLKAKQYTVRWDKTFVAPEPSPQIDINDEPEKNFNPIHVGACIRIDKLKEMLTGMIYLSDCPLTRNNRIRNRTINEIIEKLG